MANYDVDAWYPKITITEAGHTLRITEQPGGAPRVTDITLDATKILAGVVAPFVALRGRYYLHDDAARQATHKGLLHTIKTLLNSGTTAGLGTRTGSVPLNTYSWAVINPTGSSSILDGGLRLEAVAATDPFEITWTAGTTLDARLLGQLDQSPVADSLSVLDTGDEQIDSPGTTEARWIPFGIDGRVIADRKRPIPFKLAQASSERISDSVMTIWKKGRLRTFAYSWLSSAHIYDLRGEEANWAVQGGLVAGDSNNAFERVWDSLTDGDEVLIVHDKTSDLQIDSNVFEVLKFAGSSVGWEGFHSVLRDAGDFSRVGFTCFVKESNFNH